MAYVRKSKSRGKEYRQIVESYREDGKVKQRVLVHLPRFAETPEHAAEWCETAAERDRKAAERNAKLADELAKWQFPEHRIVGSRRLAEEFARDAEKYVRKAKVIRELLESGKIKPDTPEMREERVRTWEERRRARR